MEATEDRLFAILEVEQPLSVRGAFYRGAMHGLVPKTDAGYAKIDRHVIAMRRSGRIPYDWITDNTRWRIKPRTWSSAGEMVWQTSRTYRQALWDNQHDYVEVWCEKDAIAGVLSDVTAEWDVPLMVVRGHCSDTALYSAARAMEEAGRPVYVHYFGDHDKSGLHIPVVIERKLRAFAPGLPLTFTRAAVTPEQIANWGLPTRPSKDDGFALPCVEVDAVPSPTLRRFVESAITGHIDPDILARTREIESAERESLERMLEAWRAA